MYNSINISNDPNTVILIYSNIHRPNSGVQLPVVVSDSFCLGLRCSIRPCYSSWIRAQHEDKDRFNESVVHHPSSSYDHPEQPLWCLRKSDFNRRFRLSWNECRAFCLDTSSGYCNPMNHTIRQ